MAAVAARVSVCSALDAAASEGVRVRGREGAEPVVQKSAASALGGALRRAAERGDGGAVEVRRARRVPGVPGPEPLGDACLSLIHI